MRHRWAAGARAVVLCVVGSGIGVRAQDPTPPKVGLTARCYCPGTVVLRWAPFKESACTVLRSAPDGEEKALGRTPAGVDIFYDTGLPRGAVFLYRVKPDQGREPGPIPCANSAEMLVGGDFESVRLGPLTSTVLFHRAYGPPHWEIVNCRRPGGKGERAVRILHGEPPRRDGLHSILFPVDPTATYRQSGWARSLEDTSRLIGRQLLNAELKAAGGRIVAYGYAPVYLERPDGWQYCEQRLSNLPADTAFLQVWALAFNRPSDIWFDDLSFVDERTERLMAFDSATQLPQLKALAVKVGDASVRREAERLTAEIARLEGQLREPQSMALKEYLGHVRALDKAVRTVTDLMWDAKILGLAR